MSNFPSSPTVNDTYTINGFTWQWDGIAWNSYYSTLQQALQAYSISDKTTSFTLADGDQGKIFQMDNTSAMTVSVPTDATFNFGIGTQFTIVQKGTGQVTISATTPVTTTINYTPGNKTRAQWSSATLVKTAANTWLLMGDLTV